MKLNKVQFKTILKECIRELIVEGAFDTVVTENLADHGTTGQARRRAVPDFVSSFGGRGQTGTPSSADEVGEQRGMPNERLQALSRMAAAQCASGNPQQAAMMESIFSDTAKTTLQERLAAEGGGGAYIGAERSPQEEAQEMAQLEQLTGGHGAGHWAALAFGKYSKE